MNEQKKEIPTSLKGNFLIAMPSLLDPNFKQSVSCITEHTADGAVGIVINRLVEQVNSRMIFEELGIQYQRPACNFPVHIGGPVHTNEIFVLHTAPLDWDGSLIIDGNLAMSNSRSILEAIAAGQGPESFILSLGCAGWGPGQLEWEMQQNAWLTSAYDHEILFSTPVPARWETAIRQLGIDPALLTDTAGHA
jgi:putative transcriptional regulator